jgi:hypothetical protein
VDVASEIKISDRGVKILGTAQSRDGVWIADFLAKHLSRQDLLFKRLKMLPPNLALPILQKCGVPKIDFLLRNHAPQHTKQQAAHFDEQVRDTIAHISGTHAENWSRETEVLTHLPPSMGGLGLTNKTATAEAEYNGTKASLADDGLGLDALSAKKLLNKALAEEVDSFGPVPAAHRRNTGAKHAAAWIETFWAPLPCLAFSAALRFRMAAPAPGTELWTDCPGCGRTFAEKRALQEHFPGCAALVEHNAATTHHVANRGVQKLARKALVSLWNEPRYQSYARPAAKPDEDEAHEQGPDLTLYLAKTETHDFKGINPACLSHCRRSLSKVVAAKTSHSTALYKTHCDAQGERFVVTPFFMTGGFGDEFLGLVSRLCAEDPTLEFKEELGLIAAAIQGELGRVLLYVTSSAARRRC